MDKKYKAITLQLTNIEKEYLEKSAAVFGLTIEQYILLCSLSLDCKKTDNCIMPQNL